LKRPVGKLTEITDCFASRLRLQDHLHSGIWGGEPKSSGLVHPRSRMPYVRAVRAGRAIFGWKSSIALRRRDAGFV